MDPQTLASGAAIAGTCLLPAFFFGFLADHSLKKTTSGSSWRLKVLETPPEGSAVDRDEEAD